MRLVITASCHSPSDGSQGSFERSEKLQERPSPAKGQIVRMGKVDRVTTLLLARHGQSTWNAQQRWQGQADPPLSELGRQQAWSASAAVGTVDLIAASPQQRALETATIISQAVGVGPVVAVEGLRERSAGAWSGLTKDDIEEQFPDWLENDRRPDDFESDDELLARVLPSLDEIVAVNPGGAILVVCHGGVIKAVEAHLGLDDGRVPNLSGRILKTTGKGIWKAGEQIQLLDAARSTGGDGNRI